MLLLLLGLLPAEPARALLERYECARCHEIPGLASAPEPRHCVSCHRAIEAGSYPAAEATLAAWRGRLRSLPVVPALRRRLRPDFIASFLLAPQDLRPGLLATMPRLALSATAAGALAAELGVERPTPAPGFTADERRRGPALYAELGCPTCHAFTGADVPPGPTAPPTTDGVRLAPDLAYTRRRLWPEVLLEELQAPSSAMPDYALPLAEARALAAFVLEAELSPPAPRRPPARLPPLTRRVSYAEVEAKVFARSCFHCHSDPALARGDGGPGNTGGFGYPPRGLSFAGAAAMASGALGPDGRRRSVLAGGPGESILVRRLVRRQEEEAGQLAGEVGMPLGLPALTPAELQLVESWLAQGRPR